MSVCLARFDESHVPGATDEVAKCSLCTKPFVVGRGPAGTAVVLDRFNGGDVVAQACVECCPDRLTAIEIHLRKPWYVRLFSRPNYFDENYDILLDVGKFQVYMNILKKSKEALDRCTSTSATDAENQEPTSPST